MLCRPFVRLREYRIERLCRLDAGARAGFVKRVGERALTAVGGLEEAPVWAAEAVSGTGVLLALPALLQEGLIDTTEEVYGRKGFFGPHSVLLTLAFMVLLRIKSPEQLERHAPGELGLPLGLDRAREMKTLRRKEIVERGLAGRLAD